MNLFDVYLQALDFGPNVVTTKHVVERLIQRKIDVEVFARHVGRFLKNHLCQMIFDYELYGQQRLKVSTTSASFTVAFKFDSFRKKMYITTVY